MTHVRSGVAGLVGGALARAAGAGGGPVHELVDAARVLPVVQHRQDDAQAVAPCLHQHKVQRLEHLRSCMGGDDVEKFVNNNSDALHSQLVLWIASN